MRFATFLTGEGRWSREESDFPSFFGDNPVTFQSSLFQNQKSQICKPRDLKDSKLGYPVI